MKTFLMTGARMNPRSRAAIKKVTGIVLATGLLLGLVVAVQAAVLAYELSWWTVDGGGGQSQGGEYELDATTGQADAGALQGGGYSLSGGFWSASSTTSVPFSFYLAFPVVLK